jgi:acyl carrier protein
MSTNGLTTATIEAKVRDIIAEQLGVAVDDIHLASTFVEDLGADSLDVVELVMAIEEQFEVAIPDDAAENIKTVQDAVQYVEQHRR